MEFNNEILNDIHESYRSETYELSSIKPSPIGSRRLLNVKLTMATYELNNGFWPYEIDLSNFNSSTETIAHLLAQGRHMIDTLYDLCIQTDWLAASASGFKKQPGFLSFMGGASAKTHLGAKNITDSFYFEELIQQPTFLAICKRYDLSEDEIGDMGIIITAIHIELLSRYGIFSFSRPYVDYEARLSFVPSEERLRELANVKKIEDCIRKSIVPLAAPRDVKYEYIPTIARRLQQAMHNLATEIDTMRVGLADVDVLKYALYVYVFFNYDHPDYHIVNTISAVKKAASNITLLRALTSIERSDTSDLEAPPRPIYATHLWDKMANEAYESIISHPVLKTDTLSAIKQFFSYEVVKNTSGRPVCAIVTLNSKPQGHLQALHRLPNTGSAVAQYARYTELIDLSTDLTTMQSILVGQMTEVNMLAISNVAYSSIIDPEDADAHGITIGMTRNLVVLFGAAFSEEIWVTENHVGGDLHELFISFVVTNQHQAPKELVYIDGITQTDGHLICHHPLLIPFCFNDDHFYGSNEVPALRQTFKEPYKAYFPNDHDIYLSKRYRSKRVYKTQFMDGSEAKVDVSPDMLYGVKYSKNFAIDLVIPIFDSIAAQKTFTTFIYLSRAIDEWTGHRQDDDTRKLIAMHNLIAGFDKFLRPARSSSIISAQCASISRELALQASRRGANSTMPMHARLNELTSRMQHARLTTWLALFHCLKGCLVTPRQVDEIMDTIDDNHGWAILADLSVPQVSYTE